MSHLVWTTILQTGLLNELYQTVLVFTEHRVEHFATN